MDEKCCNKVVILGDASVGKTTLVQRYKNGEKLLDLPEPSVQFSEMVFQKVVHGNEIQIKIWDTVGQEKYRGITPLIMKNASVGLFIYCDDIEGSFDSLSEWVSHFDQSCNGSKIIVYSKIDLSRSNIAKGKEFASSIGAQFFKTSSISGEGVDELFNYIFEIVAEKQNEYKTMDSSIEISSNGKSNESSSCC